MPPVNHSLPTADEARADARAAHQVFMAVVVSPSVLPKPLPGLRLANALWNTADQGLQESFGTCLACMVGLRLGARAAKVEDFDAYHAATLAYAEAFEAEFRRIHGALRAGGSERDAMTEYLAEDSDETMINGWREAFARSDHSGWEAFVNDAVRTERQALETRRPRRQSWRSGLFSRQSG